MTENEVSLIFGVHVDVIIVAGENVCEKFFVKIKERFLVKNQGGLMMYTVVSCGTWNQVP